MQYLTVAEARQLESLWRNMHKKLKKYTSGYSSPEFEGNNMIWRSRPGLNPRQHRMNSRNALRAQRNFENYMKQLANRHHITQNNVSADFGVHLGSRNIARYVVGHSLLGKPTNKPTYVKSGIRTLMRTGLPRTNATRRVLGNLVTTGARSVAAVRTLQRKFRAKRAETKKNIHTEMNVLRRVPVSGIRMNNGNVRPLKPSDIAKARKYLAEQGFRTVIRTSRRRTT